MKRLKLKLVLNKGREGIPLHLLSKVSENVEGFLESLGRDLGLPKGKWIADSFRNGSVIFDTSFAGPISPEIIKAGNAALNHITNPKKKPNGQAFGIRSETYLKFAEIVQPLSEDDRVQFGVLGKNNRMITRFLTKERSQEILNDLQFKRTEYGSLTGNITVIFFDDNNPRFRLKDNFFPHPVQCEFPKSLRKKVLEAVSDETNLVTVEGYKNFERDRLINFEVVSLEILPRLTEKEFESILGCDPDFTGGLSLYEFMKRNVYDDEEYSS